MIEATPAQPNGEAGPSGDTTNDGGSSPDDPTGSYDGPRSGPRGPVARRFGDYEIEKELGRGGMGIVYRARQISLNRTVALKLLKADILATDTELRRFQNEAEAVALLDHPNIVPIYDVGEHEGCRYFTMKLIEGPSLDRDRSGYRADPQSTARLVAAAAQAMHHAHQRGILHRDLKPANILVDRLGHPHVSDFGLATRVDRDCELTLSGAIIGTPSYMAPEQTLGRRGAATIASDVYSLGGVLYALLTGLAPFRGNSVVDTLQHVRERAPEPPSKSNPNVPRDLEVICLKCLEKDPHRRYATAIALAEELERWSHGRPILARPASTRERAVKWAKRHPAVASLLTSLALVVVLAIAGISTALAYALRREHAALDALGAARTSNLANHIARAQTALRDGSLIECERQLSECPEDLRHWEYRYLDARARINLRLETGHKACRDLAFSPNGRVMATGGDDAEGVKIWDPASGRLIRTLTHLFGPVRKLAFNPVGTRLASFSFPDREPDRMEDYRSGLAVWDVESGEMVFSHESRARILAVTFRDAGKTLLSAEAVPISSREASRPRGDVSIKEWDTGTGQLTRTRIVPSIPPPTLGEFSGEAGSLYLFVEGANWRSMDLVECNLNTDSIVPSWIQKDLELPLGMAFSRNRGRMAVGCMDRVLALERTFLGTSRPPRSFTGHVGPVMGVAFSNSGAFLASSGRDRTVQLWDVQGGRRLERLEGHTDMVRCVAFSPDGARLASGCEDGSVIVWSLEEKNPVRLALPTVVYDLDFHPNSHYLAATFFDHKVRLIDPKTGRILHELGDGELPVDDVAFSADGGLMATAGRDRVTLWKVSGADSRPEIRWNVMTEGGETALHPLSRRGGVAFHPQNRYLATLEGDRATIRDLNKGGIFRSMPGRGIAVFHPDGRRILTSDEDGRMILEDLESGALIRVMALPAQHVYAAAISPDGHLLATGGGTFDRARYSGVLVPGELAVWNIDTGRRVHTLKGHSGIVESVAFSPDGKRLCSASHDGTVRLWDLTHGQQTISLQEHVAPVVRAVFSHDGSILASGASSFFDRRSCELIIRHTTSPSTP